MKKVLKIIGIILASLIGIIIIALLVFSAGKGKAAKELYAQLGDEAPELKVDGHTFRDLNKNGTLDIYEDSRVRFGGSGGGSSGTDDTGGEGRDHVCFHDRDDF